MSSDRSTSPDATQSVLSRALSRPAMPNWRRVSTAAYIVIAVVLLCLAFTFLGPTGRFLDVSNLQSIAVSSSALIPLAVGLALVLGAGHIDLSIGMNLVLSSVVSGTVMVAVAGTADASADPTGHAGLALALGLLTALTAGVLMGLVNGLLVTVSKINSFVVTLGTMGIALGAAEVITNGGNVIGIPAQMQEFGLGELLGIPYPLWVAVVVGLTGAAIVSLTRFGRHALAIGSSSSGAHRSGVKVNRTTVLVFTFAGALAGLAGFLDISRFGTTAITGHDSTMLQALSAVIIGGTSLFGGRVSIFGAVVATFIPAVLLSGFVLMGITSFYQNIAIGAVLIIAVGLDEWRSGSRT